MRINDVRLIVSHIWQLTFQKHIKINISLLFGYTPACINFDGRKPYTRCENQEIKAICEVLRVCVKCMRLNA